MNAAWVVPTGLVVGCLLFLPWWWRPWRTYLTPKVLTGLGVLAILVAAGFALHPATGLVWPWLNLTIMLCVVAAVVGGGPVTVIGMGLIEWYQRYIDPNADSSLLLPGQRGFGLTAVRAARCHTCGVVRDGAKPKRIDGDDLDLRVVLPGGAWLGVCERLSVCVCLLMVWPEGILVVIGLKGIGRYQQIVKGKDQAKVAERFLLGTFFSVLWAAAMAGVATLVG